jgi:hypothetical protein
MNEHHTSEAYEETPSKSVLRKIGEKTLYVTSHAALVAGLAAGAVWAMREADIAPLSLFGDAIDLGPHLDLDKGDSVMDVK